MNSKWWRQGGLLGITFVVVWAVVFIVRGEVLAYDEPVSKVRAFWQDHGDRYLIAQYVVVIAGLTMLIPFMVAFTTLLGRAEGEPRIWSRVSLIGGLLFVAVVLAASSAWTALAVNVDRLSDDAVVTLMQLDQGAYQAPPPLFGLFVAAASIAIVRTGAMSAGWGTWGCRSLSECSCTHCRCSTSTPITSSHSCTSSRIWRGRCGSWQVRFSCSGCVTSPCSALAGWHPKNASRGTTWWGPPKRRHEVYRAHATVSRMLKAPSTTHICQCPYRVVRSTPNAPLRLSAQIIERPTEGRRDQTGASAFRPWRSRIVVRRLLPPFHFGGSCYRRQNRRWVTPLVLGTDSTWNRSRSSSWEVHSRSPRSSSTGATAMCIVSTILVRGEIRGLS